MYQPHYKCDDKLKIYQEKIYTHYEPIRKSKITKVGKNISKCNKSMTANKSTSRGENINKMLDEYFVSFDYLSKKHGLTQLLNQKQQYMKDENFKEIENNINNLIESYPYFLDSDYLNKTISSEIFDYFLQETEIQNNVHKLRSEETYKDYDKRIAKNILSKDEEGGKCVGNESNEGKEMLVVEEHGAFVNPVKDNNQLKGNIKRLSGKEKIMLDQKTNRQGIIQEEKSHDDNEENEYDKEFNDKETENVDKIKTEEEEELPLLEEMIDKEYNKKYVNYVKYPKEYIDLKEEVEGKENEISGVKEKNGEEEINKEPLNNQGELVQLEDKVKDDKKEKDDAENICYKEYNFDEFKDKIDNDKENKEEIYSDENHASFNNAKIQNDVDQDSLDSDNYNDFI